VSTNGIKNQNASDDEGKFKAGVHRATCHESAFISSRVTRHTHDFDVAINFDFDFNYDHNIDSTNGIDISASNLTSLLSPSPVTATPVSPGTTTLALSVLLSSSDKTNTGAIAAVLLGMPSVWHSSWGRGF